MSDELTGNTEQPSFDGLDAALEHVMREKDPEDSGVAATEEKGEVTETPDVDTDGEDKEVETEEDDSEDEDSDEEETEEEDEDSDDEDTDDEDDEDEFFVLEEDGEEIKVSREEAKAGYMRNKAFTQKTQALASERKEFDGEKASLLQTKAEYVKALGELKLATSEQLKGFVGLDWQALQRDDPIEFEEKQQEFAAAKLAYEQVSQTQESQSNQLTQDAIEFAQKVRQEEFQKLVEAEPEFAEKDSKILSEIRNLGVNKYGFSEEELSQIYDHRMIRVLRDALRASSKDEKVKKGTEKLKSKTIKPKGSVSKSTAKARAAKARKAALADPMGLTMEEAMRRLHGQ